MSRRRAYARAGSRPVPITWLDPVAASPIEVAFGGLLLIVIGLLAMVWGAGYLSSWVINGEPANLTVGDAGVALARMGQNRLSWDGAWPPDVESRLAGPFWFWIVFAVEAFVLGLAFWPAWRLLGPRPSDPMPVVIEEKTPKHPRRARREAERAARAERRALLRQRDGIDPPPPVSDTDKVLIDGKREWRLVLGQVRDRLVATEKHHSVLALGPTRSGKTSGLALPAILEWAGPALVVSAKSDLIAEAWEERARGERRTWLFDPTASMAESTPSAQRPAGGHGWSPLQRIVAVPRPRNEPELDRRVRQWARARRSAQWMVNGVRRANAIEMPVAWYGAAEQMLAPLLLAAAAEELPIGQVVEWVNNREETGVREALERAAVAEATASWEGAHRYDPATTVGCYQILAAILYPFGDPLVLAQAREPQISAHGLLDGRPNTLFVLAPPNHQERLRPLFNTIMSEVIDTAMSEASASQSGRLKRPLLVIIDDAVGCAPVQLLDQLASVGAGLGIQLLTLFQDLTQLSQTYGQERATHLADSHRARVILPGITDPFTLDYLNMLIRGTRLLEPGAARGTEERAEDEAIVSRTASWMRTLKDGSAVLIYGNLAPIRIRLRPWYRDEALLRRLRPVVARERWEWFRRLRARHDDLAVGGFPNPLDSDANDREATRYWDAVSESGLLPEPRPYDDGATIAADDPTR